MQFDLGIELIISAKMLLSLVLGALIGLDRERHGCEAGIRTYAAIAVGATLFTSLADHMVNDPSATSRIVANVITGIGFLGVGVIYRNKEGLSRGLTTAATIWCTSAVGVSVGANMFIIAISATVILYILISAHHQDWYIKWKKNVCKQENENE